MEAGWRMQLAARAFPLERPPCGIFVILTIKVWSNINWAMTSWEFPIDVLVGDRRKAKIR
jgi:hypothetical protein